MWWIDRLNAVKRISTALRERPSSLFPLFFLQNTNTIRTYVHNILTAYLLLPQVGQASVMKVGLSDFHHRDGLDVSLPLFSMVEFTAEVSGVSENK